MTERSSMNRCAHKQITPVPSDRARTVASRATCDDCDTLLQYPFLEEGKTVGGRHYRRGPEVDWVEVPAPFPMFLKEQP